MKTKSFWNRNKGLFLFCIVFCLLVLPASAKRSRKDQREFDKRKAHCLAEQRHQQHQGIKTYNPNNKWQKNTKRGKK